MADLAASITMADLASDDELGFDKRSSNELGEKPWGSVSNTMFKKVMTPMKLAKKFGDALALSGHNKKKMKEAIAALELEDETPAEPVDADNESEESPVVHNERRSRAKRRDSCCRSRSQSRQRVNVGLVRNNSSESAKRGASVQPRRRGRRSGAGFNVDGMNQESLQRNLSNELSVASSSCGDRPEEASGRSKSRRTTNQERSEKERTPRVPPRSSSGYSTTGGPVDGPNPDPPSADKRRKSFSQRKNSRGEADFEESKPRRNGAHRRNHSGMSMGGEGEGKNRRQRRNSTNDNLEEGGSLSKPRRSANGEKEKGHKPPKRSSSGYSTQGEGGDAKSRGRGRNQAATAGSRARSSSRPKLATTKMEKPSDKIATVDLQPAPNDGPPKPPLMVRSNATRNVLAMAEDQPLPGAAGRRLLARTASLRNVEAALENLHKTPQKPIVDSISSAFTDTTAASSVWDARCFALDVDIDHDDEGSEEAEEIDDSEGEDAPKNVRVDPLLLARAREVEKRLTRENEMKGIGKGSSHSLSSTFSVSMSSIESSNSSRVSFAMTTSDPLAMTASGNPLAKNTKSSTFSTKIRTSTHSDRSSSSISTSSRQPPPARPALTAAKTKTPSDAGEEGWDCACGAENKDAYKFCGFCGGKREEEEPPYWECQCCGRDDNEKKFMFCVGCGTNRAQL